MIIEEKIVIAKHFSCFPFGRYSSDGPDSGERLREEFLVPALKRADILYIDFDGMMSAGSSFIEEAFGGLIRINGFTSLDLNKKIKIIGDSFIVTQIKRFIE